MGLDCLPASLAPKWSNGYFFFWVCASQIFLRLVWNLLCSYIYSCALTYSCPSYILLSFKLKSSSKSPTSHKIYNDWCVYHRYSRKMRALCRVHAAHRERSSGCYLLDLIRIHDNTLDYCVDDVHEVSNYRL